MKNSLLFLFISIGVLNIGSAQDNALQFDGFGDRVTLSGFSITTDLTMSVWFKPDAASTNGFDNRILSFGPTNRLEIGVGNGTDCAEGDVWIYDEGSGIQECISSVDLRDGNWHQYALTISGTIRTIYIDGLEVGSFTGGTDVAYTENFVIGAWTGGSSTNTNFNGLVDEVRVYDYALSVEEINESLNCQLDGDETGLVIYYTFNQGIAGGNNDGLTTLSDLTSNGNDATLSGSFELDGNTSNWVASSAIEGLCNPSIVENTLNSSLEISPNPTQNYVVLNNFTGLQGTIRVTDINGKLISTQALTRDSRISLADQNAGIYFLQVQSGGEYGMFKIVKM